MTFTFDERNLMCIYNTGSRSGLMDNLKEMRECLTPEEVGLLNLTNSTLEKLRTMEDEEFDQMELYPDFCEV